jgi:ferredoxin-type protein NapH
MVTDFAWWLRKKLKLKQIDLKFPASRKLRYWIFALSIIVSAISGIAAFEIISPIAILHRGIIFGFGFGWAAIVIVFLFDLVILENGWCGYICPLGGFYSFISKFNLIKINHIKENCTLCMKCKKICPERQVLYIVGKESGYISSGECTNCGRCIEVCDDNSLKFSLNKYKK